MPDTAPSPPPCYACVYRPSGSQLDLMSLGKEFSPRYQRHGDDTLVIDVRGLERLLGAPRVIAHEIRREAADRGAMVHVAIAATHTAARVLALGRPGITIVDAGGEADALSPLPIGLIEKLADNQDPAVSADLACAALAAFKHWGLKTLGDLAALPSADLVARMGRQGMPWQAIARGDDAGPLVPDVAEERFESTIELDWPIEELEPLSFVLTRLLEPLSTRLERRDRGAAVLHVRLRLVTADLHARRLELPTPMRDVRTLRTLALLDLESHPPPAAIDHVSIVVDPTPGRVLQHTLFTRAHHTPEQLSTLLARLGALMGQDRIGAPATVDSYRPGAFAMNRFATEHHGNSGAASAHVQSALRRCRQPVPARVAIVNGRPVRVTSDRRSFPGGAVLAAAGPWRTSGAWWSACGHAPRASESGRSGASGGLRADESHSARTSSSEDIRVTHPTNQTSPTYQTHWNCDEWDVSLSDGAVYRIFRDRETDGWFIDGIVD